MSGYSIAASVIQDELGTTRELALAGVSVYTIMFGIAPLLLAPLSELYGRRVVYIASTVVYTLFQIPQALAPNIGVMLFARIMSGIGGSTAISLLGGTLSDLFDHKERGVPMAAFAFSAFAPTGLGPVIFGYVAMLTGMRLVFWIQFALAGVLTILIYFVQRETRESVLLTWKARALRSQTGDASYASSAELDRPPFATLMRTTLTRPMHLLLVEPAIQVWTVYVAFACT